MPQVGNERRFEKFWASEIDICFYSVGQMVKCFKSVEFDKGRIWRGATGT